MIVRFQGREIIVMNHLKEFIHFPSRIPFKRQTLLRIPQQRMIAILNLSNLILLIQKPIM